MNALLLLLGRAAGLGGILLCVVAGAARLSGQYYMGNFQLTTLLQAGTAAIVMGCFFLLLALTARERKRRSSTTTRHPERR
jgi:membrane protein implicated in regulation of membrane protease activity